MDLGEKLLQARLEAGLSQRQLCGEEITRNMLSRIEHGAARPSMSTLQYLAQRLGKPVSYFLEDDVLSSPNRQVMEEARRAWQQGDMALLRQALGNFIPPDEVYGPEYTLLSVLSALALAEQEIRRERHPYARELLGKAEALLQEGCYCASELERRRLLLLGRLRGEKPELIVPRLPSVDEELLLRARAAWQRDDAEGCARLLEAVQDQTTPLWGLLRGRLYLKLGDFAQAARCLHLAEETYPRQTARPLEQCYRELGDFRQAYNYACRERSFLGGNYE